MKSRYIIIAFITLLAITSGAILISEQADNLDITLKTNGTDIRIQAFSILFFNRVPESMMAEMQEVAYNELQSDTSTADTLKEDIKAIALKYNYTATVKIDSQFGTDQLPMPATVKGTSMVPTLQDGQEIVVLKTKNFKVGDIVVARHPTYGLVVKRISQIKDGQAYLMSDNRETIITNNGVYKGLDTWISLNDIIGVVKIY